jgi:hypothetical protein
VGGRKSCNGRLPRSAWARGLALLEPHPLVGVATRAHWHRSMRGHAAAQNLYHQESFVPSLFRVSITGQDHSVIVTGVPLLTGGESQVRAVCSRAKRTCLRPLARAFGECLWPTVQSLSCIVAERAHPARRYLCRDSQRLMHLYPHTRRFTLCWILSDIIRDRCAAEATGVRSLGAFSRHQAAQDRVR